MNTTQMSAASGRLKSGTEMIFNGKQVFVEHDLQNGSVNICTSKDRGLEDTYFVILKSDLTPILRVRLSIVVKAVEPIKKVSSSRLKRLAIYRVVRDEYLAEHPVCEFRGCNSTKVTLHHKCGRVGANLIDKATFCSLCEKHHYFVEVNPTLAKVMGLSEDRI
jgi:hypothetical protein